MLNTKYVCNGDVRIAYEVHDAESPIAPWVVLVHGRGFDRSGWEPLLRPLTDHFKVLLLDNRGIGESDVPEPPYSVSAMAGDVTAVLDEIGIRHAHVIGASLGGMIAQEIAVEHPERVERLVLIATSPGGEAACPIPEPTQRLIEEMSELDHETFVRRAIENSLCEQTVRLQPHLVERLIARQLESPQRDQGFEGQAAAAQAFTVVDRLGDLRAPTLVLHGDDDHIVDPRDAETLIGKIPNAWLIRFPRCGHLIFWEQPEEVVSILVDFLKPHQSDDSRYL